MASSFTVEWHNRAERRELAVDQASVGHGGLGTRIYLALSTLVLAALSYAAFTVLDGWADWVVLGASFWALGGVIIAVNPYRRAAG